MFLLSVYRNRLESNTEHWNALLLSLRELIEWVIRKDTELTGLGPVCGDVAALQKQEASFFDRLRFNPFATFPSHEKCARERSLL